jgi:hypothetical protein
MLCKHNAGDTFFANEICKQRQESAMQAIREIIHPNRKKITFSSLIFVSLSK